jgi:signal transduction histidine kinase
VFAVALLYNQWETRQQENRRGLQQTVRTLAVGVEREIRSAARQLERVAAHPSLQPESLREFHEFMRALSAKQDEWDNLVLVRTDGRPLLDASVEFDAALAPWGDPGYQQVAETGVAAVSDVYHRGPTGGPTVSVSVPVERDGEVLWILSAQLSAPYLSALLSEPLAKSEFISSAVDTTGRIVARSHGFDRFFGQPATPGYLELIRSAPSGISRASAVDGRELVAVWERLDNGWTVGLGAPGQVVDAPLQRSMLIAGVAGLVLLAGGLITALWLSRRIGGAIDAAAEDASLLAQERRVTARDSVFSQVKRLFRAHHEASLRLQSTAAERNAALGELHAEIRRRDGFLAMLAHELRNPLAPLTNAHRLLERTERLSDTGQTALAIAQRQTRQLSRLVDDLLDVSRLTSGKITLRLAPVSMGKLVREAAQAVSPEADAKSQTLNVEVPEEPVEIVADAARVRQILDNLLVNAVKFGRSGGRIAAALAASDAEVVVTVSDDGIGVDPSRLDELFKPFSQIDPGLDRANGGLGLGLSMVRQLVQLQGGSVSAESEGLGRGARFTVRLPRMGPPAQQQARADQPGAR